MNKSIKVPESKHLAFIEDRKQQKIRLENKLPLCLVEMAALIMREEKFQVILERLIEDLQNYYELKYTRVEVE